MRPVLLAICVLLPWTPGAAADIEVYSAGKHFNSFEDYRKNRHDTLPKDMKLSGPMPEPRQAPLISKLVQEKLSKISFNSNIHHVVVDFQQNWQNSKPRFIVDADELEGAIRETLGEHQEPALLISDPQKVRILSYSPEKTLSPGPVFQGIDKSDKEWDNTRKEEGL